jgi:methionyl-tRNA formyltransferase
MKILLYTRRNVGMYCLSHLIAIGHEVVVMTDELTIVRLAERYGCPVIGNGEWERMGSYDMLLSIHGNKKVPTQFLKPGSVNIHPCLSRYKGKDPISRYIKDKQILGTVESHWMTDEIDGGEIIYRTPEFLTGECRTHADFYNTALPFYYHCLEHTLNKILKCE